MFEKGHKLSRGGFGAYSAHWVKWLDQSGAEHWFCDT